MQVLAVTFDGASVNRRFVKLHCGTTHTEPVYRVKNPYATDDRFLYFISDPPHLIKTVRNCFASNNLLQMPLGNNK